MPKEGQFSLQFMPKFDILLQKIALPLLTCFLLLAWEFKIRIVILKDSLI